LPMSWLPCVTESARERVAEEFDSRGPDACVAEITRDLRRGNPEVLDMIAKCARDVGKVSEIMVGFGMFYRLLTMQSPAVAAERPMLSPLPRVTPETRDMLVARIDEEGSEAFTMRAIEDMETDNPELLQMAHNFALRHRDYLGVMQGFALLYQALVAQGAADRTYRQ